MARRRRPSLLWSGTRRRESRAIRRSRPRHARTDHSAAVWPEIAQRLRGRVLQRQIAHYRRRPQAARASAPTRSQGHMEHSDTRCDVHQHCSPVTRTGRGIHNGTKGSIVWREGIMRVVRSGGRGSGSRHTTAVLGRRGLERGQGTAPRVARRWLTAQCPGGPPGQAGLWRRGVGGHGPPSLQPLTSLSLESSHLIQPNPARWASGAKGRPSPPRQKMGSQHLLGDPREQAKEGSQVRSAALGQGTDP